MARVFGGGGLDGKVDAALIRSDRRFYSRIYLTSQTYQPIDAFQAENRDRPGDEVCHSGATSGPRCGRLVSVNRRVRVDGVWLRAQREFRPYSRSSNIDLCRRGDSGGPVYLGSLGKGIVSSVSMANNRCYYGHIELALAALTPRFSPQQEPSPGREEWPDCADLWWNPSTGDCVMIN